jgi:thioredoxin-like negative regulator of GroEL
MEVTAFVGDTPAVLDKTCYILRFTADWCKPCAEFAPIFTEVAARYQPTLETAHVAFQVVDVDQKPEFTQGLQVTGIPTTVIFYLGEVVDRVVGQQTVAQFEAWLRSHQL